MKSTTPLVWGGEAFPSKGKDSRANTHNHPAWHESYKKVYSEGRFTNQAFDVRRVSRCTKGSLRKGSFTKKVQREAYLQNPYRGGSE